MRVSVALVLMFWCLPALDLLAQEHHPFRVVSTHAHRTPTGTPIRRVVTSEAALKDVLVAGNRKPLPPLPGVNFHREVAVVVASGTKPSGGYDILVSGVLEQREAVHVYVLEIEPGAGCGSYAAITYPVAVIAMRRFEKPVKFHTAFALHDCGDRQK